MRRVRTINSVQSYDGYIKCIVESVGADIFILVILLQCDPNIQEIIYISNVTVSVSVEERKNLYDFVCRKRRVLTREQRNIFPPASGRRDRNGRTTRPRKKWIPTLSPSWTLALVGHSSMVWRTSFWVNYSNIELLNDVVISFCPRNYFMHYYEVVLS